MADAVSGDRVRWRSLPVWLRIGILYLAARAVTTLFLVLAAAGSTDQSRFGADASIASFAVGWDAQWYWYVAVHGYPTELPLTDAGQVAENQWAFLPLFAYLAAGLGALLGSWAAGAVTISAVAGYASALVLFRILRRRVDESTALWGVVFFVAGPLGALFQVGYAESLALLWLFLALWALIVRRFAWLYLLIPLLGFTRPGVLAFSLTLALYGIWRWARRRRDPLPRREIVHIVATGLLAAAVGFAWQLIAAVATGNWSAYLQTELAWRRNWISDASDGFLPFDGFLLGTRFWAGVWGLGESTGYVLLGVAVALIAAALLFLPAVKRLGVEIRLWSASYLLYLLAVFFPQSSTFRLLLPLSPLWGAVAVPRSRLWRWTVLLLCTAGQWWWIWEMYGLANTFWRIP